MIEKIRNIQRNLRASVAEYINMPVHYRVYQEILTKARADEIVIIQPLLLDEVYYGK